MRKKRSAIRDMIDLQDRRATVKLVKARVEEGDLVEAFLGILRIMAIDAPDDSIGKRLSILQMAALKRERKLLNS